MQIACAAEASDDGEPAFREDLAEKRGVSFLHYSISMEITPRFDDSHT